MNPIKYQVALYLTPSVHKKVKLTAKKQRTTFSKYVEQAILQKLYEDEKTDKSVKEFLEEFFNLPPGITADDIDVAFIFNPKPKKGKQ